MESNFLTAVFLPLALFIIMLGMGLGLTLDDFKRVLVEPKAVILGLIAQLIMLPVVGLALATIGGVQTKVTLWPKFQNLNAFTHKKLKYLQFLKVLP